MIKYVVGILLTMAMSIAMAQQPTNPVTISDFEERLALVYWSRDYKSLVEQTEDFLLLDKTYSARNYFRIGIAHCHLGNFEKAKEAFLSGTNADVYLPYNFAGLALVSKDANEQLNLYKKALYLSKKYDLKYYSDQRPEKKELAILLPKTNAWMFHNIGIVYYEKGSYDSAMVYFKKAYAERSDDAEHLIALSLSSYLYYTENPDKTKKHLKRAESLSSTDFRIPCIKSLIEYKQNNFGLAAQYINETKSKESGNIVVMLLKEIYQYKNIQQYDFEKNIETILAKDSIYASWASSIEGKTKEEKATLLMKNIEQQLFTLNRYYNGKIYPSGGYSKYTFDGKLNIEERLYIK